MMTATIHAHGAPVLHQIVIAVALIFSALCLLGFALIARALRRRQSPAAMRRRYAQVEAPDLDGREHVLTIESASRHGIVCRPVAGSLGISCAVCGNGPCRARGALS